MEFRRTATRVNDARLRTYADSDWPSVAALWLAVFGELKAEDTRERVARTCARNEGLFVLAMDRDVVVGTVLATHDGRRAFLYHVAVDPGARRKGVATLLVREAERRLGALGIGTIHLRVHEQNAGAIAFYRSLGWTRDDGIVGMRSSPLSGSPV